MKKRIESYPSDTDLVKVIIQNDAVFHKSCKVKYKKQMFERVNKDNQKETISQVEVDSQRCTRKRYEVKNYLLACFFCDKFDTLENLHECHALYLDMSMKNSSRYK